MTFILGLNRINWQVFDECKRHSIVSSLVQVMAFRRPIHYQNVVYLSISTWGLHFRKCESWYKYVYIYVQYIGFYI